MLKINGVLCMEFHLLLSWPGILSMKSSIPLAKRLLSLITRSRVSYVGCGGESRECRGARSQRSLIGMCVRTFP